jgi:hypothetical protein
VPFFYGIFSLASKVQPQSCDRCIAVSWVMINGAISANCNGATLVAFCNVKQRYAIATAVSIFGELGILAVETRAIEWKE